MTILPTIRSSKRVAVACALVGLSLGIAKIAQAQVLSDVLATEFKSRGDKAIAEGDYAAAAEAYRRGNKIQHHPAFDFNLARALQGLGRYAEALDAVERFEREASPELKAQVPDLEVMIRELKANVGSLVLVGEPHKARVRGNERELGEYAPGRTLRCDTGPLDLVVTAEGFLPIEQHVTIAAGDTETVALKFERRDDRATITILTSVVGSQVAIDGRAVGHTPLETKLEPGSHRLRLEHADRETLETNLVVTRRERRTVTFDLERRPALWSKWWFWSGVAAVAAGAIVTGVALSTSKSATPGDIQPGVISAPLLTPH
jgi:hypothetical protein